MSNEVKEEAVWKTYPSIDFLQANQFGEIRTIDHYVTYKNGAKHFVKGHVLKQYSDSLGYMRIHLNVKGKTVNLQVHRIVASCFLPNPDNLPQVNHKDCNPSNNNVNNLEFCTPQYNTAYREKYGTSAAEVLGRPVFAVNLETSEVLHFETQREAARQLGINYKQINKVLKGRLNQTGGFWFTEDESKITEEKIQEIKDKMNFLGGVFAVNLKSLEVLRFKSQCEAARQLDVSQGNIWSVFNGRQKQTGGYWFCRADEHAVEKTRVKFGDEVADEVEKLMNEN